METWQPAIRFEVPGVPAPQGSKTRTRWGLREDNENTMPWRGAVAYQASLAMAGSQPLIGPLEMRVVFRFPRPQSHYRTGKHAAELRPTAPSWHASKPDCDKLLRAIGDAITGIVCRDDAQIAVVIGEKIYGEPGAEIMVSEATRAEAERA